MIDTSKPMEFFSLAKQAWVPFRYLATASNGNIIGEREGDGDVIVGQYDFDADCLRNKPEPKRRPLSADELHSLVGTVVTRSAPKRVTTIVQSASNGIAEIWGVYYTADEFLTNDWRRLDGSGLWVEE